MGVNAQTSVPAFTAGQVLTAAEMTEVNTGIPVFATTTTRDAAFGGTGEKTLAEGQYCYLESISSLQVYNGSTWVNTGSSSLTLISATSIGSGVASVAISSAFSATYDNYLITMSNSTWSANGQAITFILTGSTASYYSNLVVGRSDTGAITDLQRNNAASAYIGITDTNKTQNFAINIFNPFAAAYTNWSGTTNGDIYSGIAGGQHQIATSYTGFTLASISGATMTGGTVRVFGYSNS
jgi:hypothetical protein